MLLYFIPSVCPDGRGGFIPDPDDCNKYFTCDTEGNKVSQQCTGDRVFNPETGACVNPWDLTCSGNTNIFTINNEIACLLLDYRIFISLWPMF